MAEEFEDITLSPGWIIITLLSLINEIIDWAGIYLNITGVWVIIIFVLNLITLLFVLGWRISSEGFSFSAIFGNKKRLLILIAEHIPGLGDIIPGWLWFMWLFRKKKRQVKKINK